MSRCIIGGTWEDAAHLSEQGKADLIGSYQAFQLDARTKGIPQLGAGAVYPFAESNLVIDGFKIPESYRRAFGLDTARAGVTAAVWGALDVETDVLYLTHDYRRSQAEIYVHVKAMQAVCDWNIPGVGDAAAVLDEDRTQFIDAYRKEGLDIELPNKSVEFGIQAVYDRMSSGRLRIFSSCRYVLEELRMYRRDEKGRIVKERDHCMDAMRYLVFSGLQRAKTKPQPDRFALHIPVSDRRGGSVGAGPRRARTWRG